MDTRRLAGWPRRVVGLFITGLGVMAWALLCGCQEPLREQRGPKAEPPPITAARVHVGPLGPPGTLSASAGQVRQPKWLWAKARSLGLAVYGVDVWQEVPATDTYRVLESARAMVSCRVVERREDRIIVEASAPPARKRIVLKPGTDETGFIHLSGPDAVAVRLGWEGKTPPPIFARALLVHENLTTRRGWPADLPDWAVKGLTNFHAVGGENLGTGKWIKLTPDAKSLGAAPRDGEILARIRRRDRNGWVSAEAVLAGTKDEDGRPLRRSATVQPVMEGNEWPGTICTFQRSDSRDTYVVVVFHYGPVDGD